MGEIQTWDHYNHQDMSEADLDSETELSTRDKAKIKHYQEAHWKCWKMQSKTRWMTSKMGKAGSDGSFLMLCKIYGRIYGKLSWYLVYSKINNDQFDGSCSDLQVDM